MKKNKKIIIGWIVLLIIVGAAVLGIVILNKNDNRLNVIEKQWINENNKIIVNIGVKNDANVFGNDGSGVFYDFITDFSNEYSLTLNPTTYTKSKSGEEVYFRVVNELSKKDLVLYQDHYVLISKNNSSFSNFQDLQSLKIGILSSDATLINNYIKDINNISFTEYSKKEQLLNEFDKQEDINYILVPLVEYLDIALKKDNYINFHVSDIPSYYT